MSALPEELPQGRPLLEKFHQITGVEMVSSFSVAAGTLTLDGIYLLVEAHDHATARGQINNLESQISVIQSLHGISRSDAPDAKHQDNLLIARGVASREQKIAVAVKNEPENPDLIQVSEFMLGLPVLAAIATGVAINRLRRISHRNKLRHADRDIEAGASKLLQEASADQTD